MYPRRAQIQIEQALKRKKSVLVLGPRQVGKTTLLELNTYDIEISLLLDKTRIKYESDPDLLLKEVEAASKPAQGLRVFIDEVQLVPKLLNVIQYIVDKKMAQVVLTGSSARKIRKQTDINLLPGRMVLIRLDSLSYTEHKEKSLDRILLYGELPGILTETKNSDRNVDLESYVVTYLEEEIRKEAATKNLPAFYRFLELAALESGKMISFRKLSQDLGVAHSTVSSYYDILEDSMIVLRIDPYTQSATRKKLTKSSKYLFFDMGVRRVAAKEGLRLGRERMGELFENYVGLELQRLMRFHPERSSLSFWRDPDGPEVDWLIKKETDLIPVEVKYREIVDERDCRHLNTFLDEYQQNKGYVVCLAERPYRITDRITALPWQNLESVLA